MVSSSFFKKITSAEQEPKFQKKISQEEPIVVPEKKNINLATSVTPENAEVKWFKDGTEIRGNKKYEIQKDGATRTLTVKQAEAKDSGVYTCEMKGEKQQFQVQVQGERNCSGLVRRGHPFPGAQVQDFARQS